MASKKQLLKEIEQLKSTIQDNQKQWMTNQDYYRQLEYNIKQIQQHVLDDNNIQQEDIFSKIANNNIPEEFKWKYWVFINQLTYYWIGKYNNYKSQDKIEIELAKYIAIMYGYAAYYKKDKKAYYFSIDNEAKCYIAYPARNFIGAGNIPFKFTSDNNGTKWQSEINKDIEHIKIQFNDKDFVICRWRYGDVGNFIWYLQDALYFLLTKQIVISNASVLTNSLYIETNGVTNNKTIQEICNPTKPIKIIPNIDLSKDFKIKDALGAKMISFLKDSNINNFGNELILTTKFIQEIFYTTFGIPITSAKNQSLSADANLSVTQCENISKIHDMFIEQFHNAIGIDFNIDDKPMHVLFDKGLNITQYNSEKSGMGKNANTDGDLK